MIKADAQRSAVKELISKRFRTIWDMLLHKNKPVLKVLVPSDQRLVLEVATGQILTNKEWAKFRNNTKARWAMNE